MSVACTCDPGLPKNVTNAQCPVHGILAFMRGDEAAVGVDVEQEVIAAAREFVRTTSVFRQAVVCRPAFERLAVALLALSEAESNG